MSSLRAAAQVTQRVDRLHAERWVPRRVAVGRACVVEAATRRKHAVAVAVAIAVAVAVAVAAVVAGRGIDLKGQREPAHSSDGGSRQASAGPSQV